MKGKKGKRKKTEAKEGCPAPDDLYPLSPMLSRRGLHLQSEGLVPLGVERALDGPGLLLALTFGIRNQFQLDVGI